MPLRTLVVVARTEEELLLARRHLGYDALVVVVPEKPDAKLSAALAATPKVQVEEVPGEDVLACLTRLQGLLAAARKAGTVRVAVDGGTSAMSAAAFLACLSAGVEAYFLLNKVVRLPVLRARSVRQRFPEEQAKVLRALESKATHQALADRTGLPVGRVREALLALKKEGAVTADAEHAQVTRLGAYYRAGLAA